jgi:hypothetical protein
MTKNPLLESALRYLEMGFSVIPIVPGEKKPCVKWEPYQKERASKEQITAWWTINPKANIGIITGEISDLFVVDIDSEEGQQNLLEYGFDSIVTPTVKTPRGGQHLYFKYPGGNITIGAGKIPGTDFRGNGGFVVAPPSINGKGKKYEWIVDLSHERSGALPSVYLKRISTLYIGNVDKTNASSLQASTESTSVNIWEHGKRDENLFHVANCLAKTRNEEGYIRQTLRAIMSSWGEQDERWVDDKIGSALKRVATKERNLAAEVREFILSTSGILTDYKLDQELHLSTREEKKNRSIILSRLSKGKDAIIRKGRTVGTWETIDQDEEEIDYENADIIPIQVKFPLGVHEYVKIHRGNLIIIAGESNAGKTAFCLNMALDNKDLMKVNYMSSEMKDGSELRIRMDEFNKPLSVWKPIRFTFRADNFPDKVDPDGFNIIDYLDEGQEGEAYKMPMRIRLIADKLKTGIALIAIQKDPNKALGFGGSGTLNRARLYLTIQRSGILKIEKAKIWRDKEDNPNGKYIKFTLAAGCRFKNSAPWEKD